MKATGIIRRIDDLGRIVIPKEIRHPMDIKEGDPLEIYIEGNMICFKPYGRTEQIANGLEDILNKNAVHLTDEQVDAFNALLKSLRG